MSVRSSVALLLAAICCAVTALGTAPAKIDEIATIEDLVSEIDSKITLLRGSLETSEKFDAAREKDVWQAFGVISVMGQSVAEHPKNVEAGFSGAAIRDAALKFQRKSDYAEAQAALTAVTAARNGEGSGDADVPWNKLIRMHPMMEEINSRNAALIPVMKRPRGKPDEARHATTIALLSLAMYADTHEVKKEAEIPEYQELASGYRSDMLSVAAAIRNKDGKTARQHFDAANEKCDACHEKWRDKE
jgi:cytochrome c556